MDVYNHLTLLCRICSITVKSPSANLCCQKETRRFKVMPASTHI